MRPTPIDLMLQRHAPVEFVPVYGQFERLDSVGHRFLVARDGLWLEVRRAWAYIRWPIAQSRKVPIPAGELTREVDLKFGRLPRWLVDDFVEMANEASPAEVGAVGVWDEGTESFELMFTRTLQSGIGHLRYQRPEVAEGRHIVMDLHSHGQLKAYFSKTDLADTGSEVVICVVVGTVNDVVSVKASLFACGLQIPVAFGSSDREEAGAVLQGAWVGA
jgi:PRTRC genetic system protein A